MCVFMWLGCVRPGMANLYKHKIVVIMIMIREWYNIVVINKNKTFSNYLTTSTFGIKIVKNMFTVYILFGWWLIWLDSLIKNASNLIWSKNDIFGENKTNIETLIKVVNMRPTHEYEKCMQFAGILLCMLHKRFDSFELFFSVSLLIYKCDCLCFSHCQINACNTRNCTKWRIVQILSFHCCTCNSSNMNVKSQNDLTWFTLSDLVFGDWLIDILNMIKVQIVHGCFLYFMFMMIGVFTTRINFL